ncbi:AI-2E family transporter [Flavobacterium macrobrachii]|uniref:AI-2E family transporter n=1 Tax=Flavobacterium macrobrachii TaxID=591204 RepID=A0ABS2CWH4_9FLAO|nr:AI-2E family transporter [Flavobacterium macrobrachii]
MHYGFFIVLLVFVLYVLQSLIVPILFAIILSISIFPIVKFLERKLKFKRFFSALTAIVVLFIIVGLLFTFIGIQLSEIVAKSDIYAIKLERVFNDTISEMEQNFNLDKKDFIKGDFDFGKTLKDNFSNIISFLGASGNLLSDIVLIPLYMFFFYFIEIFFKFLFIKFFVKEMTTQKLNYLFRNYTEFNKII